MNEHVIPITSDDSEQTAARLTIDPMLQPGDGSYWAFNGTGYAKIVEPWAVEDHISPISRTEHFGDVEGFVAYIKMFGGNDEFKPFLTWSELGLKAILDYHAHQDAPGRCQWIADHPFERSKQWTAWGALADGRARSQKDVVEALEDMAEDILDPDAATITALLRSLKATSKAEGTAELRPDGTTSITYAKVTTVKTGGVDVPSTIKITVPVFKGHTETNDDGKVVPVRYSLTIRIRVDSDDGKVSFRLSRPQAETVFESALMDRIETAKGLLGEDFPLLRSTVG